MPHCRSLHASKEYAGKGARNKNRGSIQALEKVQEVDKYRWIELEECVRKILFTECVLVELAAFRSHVLRVPHKYRRNGKATRKIAQSNGLCQKMLLLKCRGSKRVLDQLNVVHTHNGGLSAGQL